MIKLKAWFKIYWNFRSEVEGLWGSVNTVEGGGGYTDDLRKGNEPSLDDALISSASSLPVGGAEGPGWSSDGTHDSESPSKASKSDTEEEVAVSGANSISRHVEDNIDDIGISDLLKNVADSKDGPSNQSTGHIAPHVNIIPYSFKCF